MSLIHPVILCGGSGTRLWPVSRKPKPKPFLSLVGEQTLFEATLARCADRALFARPIIVTGAEHLPHVEAQLGEADARIVVEPEAKNTAPAIALAAALLPEDAVMLVCPSDHHVANVAAFVEAVGAAAGLAGHGHMVALGITPDRADTGFGYIRRGEPIVGGYDVAEFVEKPDSARAEQFLASGEYSWNGGIFAFRVGAFLTELAAHRPVMAQAVAQAATEGRRDGTRFFPAAAPFAASVGESVDYAVMENTDRAAVVPVNMGWSDIGNWQSLHAARTQDAAGNSLRGPAELVDCRGVLVDSDGPRVSVIGLQNVAVVVNGNEVLVTTMADAQLVGKLPGALEQ